MPHFYKHKFQISEKPGTWIFVQTDEERENAKSLTKTISKHWSPPQYFYHLAKGGHLKALHRHKHDSYFVRLDIEKFFGTITRNKVCRAAKKIGLSFVDSQSIAHRSCVTHEGKRFLPFGYIQSPLLASIVLDQSALGCELMSVRKSDVNISVFMDDILLSHPDSPELLGDALMRLEKAAEKSHFSLSVEKSQGPAACIEAFNIVVEKNHLTLNQKRYEDFAQSMLQYGD